MIYPILVISTLFLLTYALFKVFSEKSITYNEFENILLFSFYSIYYDTKRKMYYLHLYVNAKDLRPFQTYELDKKYFIKLMTKYDNKYLKDLTK